MGLEPICHVFKCHVMTVSEQQRDVVMTMLLISIANDMDKTAGNITSVNPLNSEIEFETPPH